MRVTHHTLQKDVVLHTLSIPMRHLLVWNVCVCALKLSSNDRKVRPDLGSDCHVFDKVPVYVCVTDHFGHLHPVFFITHNTE